MENLFSTLVNDISKTQSAAVPASASLKPAAMPEKPQLASVKTSDLVARWKVHETPEVTAELLKRMRPTMSSAIESYARGQGAQLEVAAAHLTLDALRSYSPEYGTEPSTYVFHNLKRLSRLGTAAANIIPQSEARMAARRNLQGIIDKFTDSHDREPTMTELADMTGYSVKKLDSLMDDNVVISESSTLTEDSHKDTQGAKDLTDNDYFEYVYASVSPTDKKIMEWTSGIHGGKTLSNNQIASKLHISPAAVSQRKGRIQQLLSDVRSLV